MGAVVWLRAVVVPTSQPRRSSPGLPLRRGREMLPFFNSCWCTNRRRKQLPRQEGGWQRGFPACGGDSVVIWSAQDRHNAAHAASRSAGRRVGNLYTPLMLGTCDSCRCRGRMYFPAFNVADSPYRRRDLRTGKLRPRPRAANALPGETMSDPESCSQAARFCAAWTAPSAHRRGALEQTARRSTCARDRA